MTGRLVVLEGPDGVGKSTLAALLCEFLSARGCHVVRASFPGSEAGTIGKLVYDLHHQSSLCGVTGVSSLGLQALHMAAHLDAIERRICPSLESGATVILDRFWWSTWVYGQGAHCDPTILEALIEVELLAWGDVIPDPLVLILPDAPWRQADDFHAWMRTKRLYEQLAGREASAQRLVRLTNNDSIEMALRSVIVALESK